MSEFSSSRRYLIYGAHLVALELSRCVRAEAGRESVIGFAVTSMDGNPEQLEGLTVRPIAEYAKESQKARLTVLIATPEQYQEEIAATLQQYGFPNVEKWGQKRVTLLREAHVLRIASGQNPWGYRLSRDRYDYSWLNLTDASGEWVVKYPGLFYRDAEEAWAETCEHDIRAEMEQTLGPVRYIRGERPDKAADIPLEALQKEIAVYVVTSHRNNGKTSGELPYRYLHTLQAGAALTNTRMAEYADDEGDNISKFNPDLAELTAAYWIWKHAPQTKYKGLCHYRRIFCLPEQTAVALEEENIDALLPIPRYVPGGVGRMFAAETPAKDFVLEKVTQEIATSYPEQAEKWEQFLAGRLYCPNNMVIAKSTIYNAYAEWLLRIIKNIYLRVEKGKTDRHLAYAAELITTFYLFSHRTSSSRMLCPYHYDA